MTVSRTLRAAGAACLLLAAVLSLSLPPALADDDEPAPDPKPAPSPDDPKAPEKPDVNKVYVPFRDLEKIFEKEGEGVFLPYKEFRRLWELAHKLPPDTSKPPVSAAVRSAAYSGTVEDDIIRFEAKVEVEVLDDGWQRVPLNYAGIGVEKATIDGKPALLVPTKAGYDLLLENAGRRTLDLVLRAAAPAKGDTRTAEFSLPPVPLARLSLWVPGKDTEVTIAPRLASTTKSAGASTELMAFLGPVSKVKLTWRRKPEDTPTVDALVFAEESLDVRVDRGVVRSTLRADLSVRRAPLSRLTVSVPSEAVVLYVQGEGIRTWTRSDGGDKINIEFRAPVREKYALRVGLERALPPPPVGAVLPMAFIDGLERERGFLRVQAADGVKIEPSVTPGLVQIDLRDLPKDLQGAAPGRAFAFRFPARPGETVFDVQALEPRVSASLGNRVGIRPESLDLRCIAHVTVERAGIFHLAFSVPEALEVSDVTLKGAELDDWTIREDDGKRTLKIALRDRLLGKADVTIFGRTRIEVSEKEGAPAFEQDLPLVLLQDAAHIRGFVAVHIDPALDHKEKSRRGLTTLDVGAVAACHPPALAGDAARLPLIYRFEHREGDIALAMDLKRKAPTITCAVESWARLEPGKTRMGATLRFHVAFRGVRTFRFRAPLALAKRLHLADPGLELIGPAEEMKPADAGDDWQPVNGVWTVKLPAPRTGPVPIGLLIDDQPEEELASGGVRTTALPAYVPLEAGGAPLPNVVHHVAVRRDALLEVEFRDLVLGEEIDARELPTPLRDPDNFLAFRSYAPGHGLGVEVTKHDYEPVADVVVSHMHIDTVVPVEGRATSEAFLVVRSNTRQYLELELPPGTKIRAVRVGEKTESPRVGKDGTVLVPLLALRGKDQAFTVALYYDHDVERSGTAFEDVRLVSPVPIDVKSDILTWRVWMPDGPVYTSFGGSVLPVDPYKSWAARALERVSKILAVQEGATRLDVRRLMNSYKSPFTDRQHEGKRINFQGRVGTGDVVISSAAPGFFAFWKLLWGVAAFVGAMFLMRIATGIGAGKRFAFGVLLLLLIALLIPAGFGAAHTYTFMLLGVLLAGFLAFLGWAAGAWRAARERAAEALPEPPEPMEPAPEGGAA